MSLGFNINECEKCVHVKDTEHGSVIVCLYVDDMFIVCSDDKLIISTKNKLNSRFDMKDMGPTDESKSHLFLIHFFGMFLTILDIFLCQIMEYSPTSCFTGVN